MLKTLVFVVFLFYSSVICQKWCQYIKKDGRYAGLGIYHRVIHEDNDNSFVMFNRFGNEWRFEVTNPPEIGIQLIDNSVKPFFAQNLVNRFSVYEKQEHGLYSKHISCECILTSIPERIDINIDCTYIKGRSDPHNVHNIRRSVRNRVILKAQPFETVGFRESFIMMLKKGGHPNDYDPIAFNPCTNDLQNCTRLEMYCKPVPKFIRQMNPKLFNSIEGVVDFNFGEKEVNSGHLVLFNISGRPKICVTLEDQNISAECNSAEKMRPLFKECFKYDPTSSPTPTPTITSTPKIETKSTKFWLILVIILIIIGVIVAIVCFCCRKRRRNPNLFNDAFTTELRRDPKTLSSRREQTSTGSNTLIDSTKSTHKERTKTTKSPSKGTQFKTGVKTTKSPAKTSAKPSQSPKT